MKKYIFLLAISLLSTSCSNKLLHNVEEGSINRTMVKGNSRNIISNKSYEILDGYYRYNNSYIYINNNTIEIYNSINNVTINYSYKVLSAGNNYLYYSPQNINNVKTYKAGKLIDNNSNQTLQYILFISSFNADEIQIDNINEHTVNIETGIYKNN